MKLRNFAPGAIEQKFEGLWEDGKLIAEYHSSTCAHCQRITTFPTQRSIMEYVDICRHCMKLICLECYGKGCTPWIKRIEQAEEKAERSRQRKRLGY